MSLQYKNHENWSRFELGMSKTRRELKICKNRGMHTIIHHCSDEKHRCSNGRQIWECLGRCSNGVGRCSDSEQRRIFCFHILGTATSAVAGKPLKLGFLQFFSYIFNSKCLGYLPKGSNKVFHNKLSRFEVDCVARSWGFLDCFSPKIVLLA